MTDTELNKRLCEKLGIEWHEDTSETSSFFKFFKCSCGKHNFRSVEEIKIHIQKSNPDFTVNAKTLIEAIKGKEYEGLFFAQLMYGNNANVEGIDDDGLIDRDYILNPRLLCERFLEWEG